MPTVKCPCGQGFVVDEDELGRPVTCPTCGRENTAADAERPVEVRPPPGPEIVACDLCGRGGAVPVDLMRVVSLLLISWPKRWRETLCPMCTRRRALFETMITTFLGWWGIPFGLMYTPMALLLNARTMARHSDLPGPFGVIATTLVAGMPVILLAIAAGWFPAEPVPDRAETPPDPLAQILWSRASSEMAAGRMESAAGAFDELLRRKPDWPGAAAAAGKTYVRVGRNADAVRVLRASGDPAVRPLLAEALLALGRPEDALAELVDESVDVRAPALVRLGEFVRAARLEPAGPASSLAITHARVSLGAPDWAGAARAATTPEARVLLLRSLECFAAAERVARGDDAAWLALDRGDLAAVRRHATTSPRGAVARGIAAWLAGESAEGVVARGDGEPGMRLVARALTDPKALILLTTAVSMTEEERWAADLVLAIAARDAGHEERFRALLRRAQQVAVETPGRVLAGWLLGASFEDRLGRR